MPRRSPLLLAFVLLVFAPLMSFGQVDHYRWVELREKGELFYQKSVQEELKLTEEQIATLKPVFGQVNRNTVEFNRRLLAAATPEDVQTMNKKITEYFGDVDTTVASILDADQLQRLQQIHLQSLGFSAMRYATYAKALELSSQQLSQSLRLGTDFARLRMRSRPGAEENHEKTEELRKQINDQFLGLLSDEQKKTWEMLLGKPFVFRRDEAKDSRMAMAWGNLPAIPDFSLSPKMMLLRIQPVQTELQLTDAQIAVLNEAQLESHNLSEEGRKIAIEQANRREEIARISAGLAKASQKAISENLTADQLRRLHELYLQYSGPRLLSQRDIAKTLGLSGEQQSKSLSIVRQFAELSTAFRAESSEEGREKIREKFKEDSGRRDAQLLELLTDEQRTKWDQLLGKPFPIEQLRGSEVQPGAGQSPPK